MNLEVGNLPQEKLSHFAHTSLLWVPKRKTRIIGLWIRGLSVAVQTLDQAYAVVEEALRDTEWRPKTSQIREVRDAFARLERDEVRQKILSLVNDIQGDAAGAAALAKAKAIHGAHYDFWLANVKRGLPIAAARPDLREILDDPRAWGSLDTLELLANLGMNAPRGGTRPTAAQWEA